MFSFFSRKKYLIDCLEGFIDIHNHILPGIDDGAKTVKDSIELIRGFAEFGVKKFIATPHIMNNYYPNTPETITNSLTLLKNRLSKNNIKDVSVEAAAEHMIDDNFETILEKGAVMPLRQNYLLVEMSYLQPPLNFEEAIVKTVSKGFYPILAHPERYNFLHQRMNVYSTFKKQGILFQLNLLSLGDYYGKEVTKMTSKLLEEGYFDFVASDIHNLIQLNSLKTLTISKKVETQLLPMINSTIQAFH